MTMTKAGQLRQLITAPEILVLPGVYDGFSTRLVQQRGFRAAMVGGAGISESRLGLPDVGVMGLEENVAACRALAASSSLPLLADGDTGYGNAVNVFHTVRAFEQAGVAGVLIEDQTWPKRCGHMAGKQVIPADEMVEKMHAAVEARRDADFVLLGRTDAYAAHGIGEAIDRLNRYAEAGADLLLADAILTEEDIAVAARSVCRPLLVNMGFGIRARKTTPLISARRLQELGVAVVLYSRMLAGAAIAGMRQAIEVLERDLAAGTTSDNPPLVASFEELNELVGFAEIRALEDRFLTPDDLRARYGAAAAARH